MTPNFRPGQRVTVNRLDGSVLEADLRTTVDPGNPEGAWLVQPVGSVYVIPAVFVGDGWQEIRWPKNRRK